MTGAEGRVLRIMSRQHGLITRSQAIGAGFTVRQIERRLATGEWVIVQRGVYRPVSAVWVPEQSVLAACLAVNGVASHRTAARLWKLRGFTGRFQGPVDVTVALRRRVQLRDATLHLVDALDRRDTAILGVVPIMTPAATLLDLAASAPDLVETALEDALLRDLTQLGRLHLTLKRVGGRGKPGSALLGRLLADRDNQTAPTHSELEDAFVTFVRRYGLPEPIRQVPVLDPPADFGFPSSPVLVELDSRRWHGGRHAQTRDRRRDREARAAGYTLVRITWDELHYEADAVAADLIPLLERAA